MIIKKYKSADLESKKGSYFAIGLLLVLASVLLLFEMKLPEEEVVFDKSLSINLIEAEVIPVSKVEPPPPPPPPQVTTTIQIVANEEEIVEELVIEDLEIDENSEVDIEVVAVEMEEEEIVEVEIFTIVEQMPAYPGGIDAMFRYISTEIKYPPMALDARIMGKVYIEFVVSETGAISDVKVLRGIGGGCDEEAIRVVRSMPDWTPGKQRGKAVKVRYNLPINFILKDN